MTLLQPVEYISLDLLKRYSIKLADRIEKELFIPDHVLVVERAGVLIGAEIANYFHCSISSISTCRSGGKAKSKIKKILRYLPRGFVRFLRLLELNSGIHAVKRQRNVVCKGKAPPKDKNILIVDDAIDTGNSILAVYNYLVKKGYSPNRLRIAVITTTTPNPVKKADVSLYNQVICAFPWSLDSKEFDQAWALYHERKASIQ